MRYLLIFSILIFSTLSSASRRSEFRVNESPKINVVETERVSTIYRALSGEDTKVFIVDRSIVKAYQETFRRCNLGTHYGFSVYNERHGATITLLKGGQNLGRIFFFYL